MSGGSNSIERLEAAALYHESRRDYFLLPWETFEKYSIFEIQPSGIHTAEDRKRPYGPKACFWIPLKAGIFFKGLQLHFHNAIFFSFGQIEPMVPGLIVLHYQMSPMIFLISRYRSQ